MDRGRSTLVALGALVAAAAAPASSSATVASRAALGAVVYPAQVADARDAAVTGPCADRTDRPPSPTSETTPTGPASDLFCIELLPTASVDGPRGLVELGRAATPFGTAVTADGSHVVRLTGWFDGLPDPSTLGPYTTYVAWAATPAFSRVVKLGEVGNGRVDLGELALNRYLVMVSAEASAEVSDREGRLVLRGRSPSSLMEAHDLLAQAPSALRMEEGDLEGMPGMGDAAVWTHPPGYPGVAMLPGVMGLRPEVTTLLPGPEDMAGAAGGAGAPGIADLPEARPAEIVELPDGGTLDLEAGFVRREIEGRFLVMMAFNGQHPGPLIRVREASTVFVNFTNSTSLPTAVHWHGIRLDNRYDGVPGVTQEPVQSGETFRYQVHFPDPGVYWYHPHHREDVQQEMGLYGNMLVDALAADYYGPANRDEVLMLDDILLDERGIVPFGRESANYMLMGRFGNVFLVNGEPRYALEVDRGEVVRFHLTNVSNTRTFNVSFRKADGAAAPGSGVPLRMEVVRMKVVASDVGRFERESWAESAVLAPAERYVVEVRFEEPGRYELVNSVQGIDHRQGVYLPERTVLGAVTVGASAAAADHEHSHEVLRENEDVVADIDRYRDRFDDEPDRTLVLSLDVDSLPRPVEQSMLYDWVYFNPVEWTGTMPMMNWATTGEEVRWILRDPDTGAENMDIEWDFEVGDVIRIRVHNDRNAFHAMQHPLHIHGQRFLVLEQNGVATENLVWKDTVLLPSGSTTDILLELSNPGRWMVHCHIAEHLESGMKFVMNVRGNPEENR